MDRISDSGSDDLGSIPNGGTSRNKLSYLIGYESTAHIMKRILISLAAAICFCSVGVGSDTGIS